MEECRERGLTQREERITEEGKDTESEEENLCRRKYEYAA